MENYIVLDIETPNRSRSSISAIGIVIVENNEIKDTVYSLINPEDTFEDFIIEMTGIDPEMVKDKPKFNEFWPEIKELLNSYPIVGHNITFDLNVISTALEHYNIKAPSFKYYCTLKLAFKRLELKSYALENIMNYLNIKYDAHNALEDAKASYELFKYLNSIRKITPLDERIYTYNRREFNQLNRECVENINNLYGMCQALNYKENITQNQLSLFEKWLNENFENREYTIFNGILTK